jgi:hypothetical protein
MESKLRRGDFVHVVATVDFAKEAGQIRYVNPAKTGTAIEAPGDSRVEITVEDATGGHKKTIHPVVRFSSPEAGKEPTRGLIQEDIEREPWMNIVRLLINGHEVSKFEGGEPSPRPGMLSGMARAIGLGGMVRGMAVPQLSLETAPDRPHRRQLRIQSLEGPRKGVSYTVQVQPEGSKAWETLAIGRETPEIEIDRNQFPGSRLVNVRVLETTGFDEHVMAEQKFDLEK